ncbi:MAG: hypothetical protein WCD89_24070 [Anaerocolumna sp.]
MNNIKMDFAKLPLNGIPDMMDGIENLTNGGIFEANIVELEMNQVTINGFKGKGMKLNNIKESS